MVKYDYHDNAATILISEPDCMASITVTVTGDEVDFILRYKDGTHADVSSTAVPKEFARKLALHLLTLTA